jgi:hypothetical protein
MSEVGSGSQAGPSCQTEGAGLWWAAVPESAWPKEADAIAEIRRDWREPFGDRRQEIVIIGIGMDEPSLRAGFDRCLLSDAELAAGPKAWARLSSPFLAVGLWSRRGGLNVELVL